MYRVIAVIKPFRLDAVVEALRGKTAGELEIEEVRGFGRQKGHLEQYSGREYSIDFLPKVRIEFSVTEEQQEEALAAVIDSARTGRIGDGKIFVRAVEAGGVAQDMRDIYQEIVRIQRDGGRAALATVIGTKGSTPGKSTMKMLVRNGDRPIGSVGGGCVEAEVIERGLEVARTERAQRFGVDLNENENPETGLVCGGRVEIFIEPIVMPNVFVFGAGHVGRAVCEIAVPAGFRCVVVDDREEFCHKERFPMAAECVASDWSSAVGALDIGAEDFVLIMTRGHKDDLAVLREVHRQGVAPRYLGMIGSKSKHLTLRRHLREEGLEDGFMDRVKTPIGLDIGARSAEEIAVSVVAELIQLRRGAETSAS